MKPRKLKPQQIAKALGLNYGELALEQQRKLNEEADKQNFIRTIRHQGFVRARWHGHEILPGDTIGDLEDD